MLRDEVIKLEHYSLALAERHDNVLFSIVHCCFAAEDLPQIPLLCSKAATYCDGSPARKRVAVIYQTKDTSDGPRRCIALSEH